MTAPRDLATRLKPFLDRGLIGAVPTRWQLLAGQVEMAPYVVMPDEGDAARYEGAMLSHPLLRTPLLLSQIGWEHLRIGHGLGASLPAQIRHLNFVLHEGMPVYDLQVMQTHPDGLERLRHEMVAIERAATRRRKRNKTVIDWVIPEASAYRRAFVEQGGYIDRAAAFEYPTLDETADFLRPEFTSLVNFINYCLRTFDKQPARGPLPAAATIAELATRRFRRVGLAA